MSRYISPELRDIVRERARRICEYCLFFEGHSFIKFQIEHIISLKHGGLSVPNNLALSCFYCNNHKGSDLGTILEKDEFQRFYHPRKDKWKDHFELNGHLIIPKTSIGKATVKILKMNDEERLMERLALIENGFFPHPNAEELISS